MANLTQLPVFALPNAGFPTADAEGELHYHLDPAYFRRYSELYMPLPVPVSSVDAVGLTPHILAPFPT